MTISTINKDSKGIIATEVIIVADFKEVKVFMHGKLVEELVLGM